MSEITIDEAQGVLRADYYEDVQGVVDGLHEAIMSGELETEEDAETWLHETVDGHGRVIYTGQAIECLRYCSSGNENAYTDQTSGPATDDSGCINWSILAYYAFLADIRADLDISDWLEEKEEADAEDEENDGDEDNEDEEGN